MKIKRLPDGQLRYSYAASPDLSFEFSLLSEVGEPWQPEAVVLLKELEAKGYEIVRGRELIEHPWVADFAKKKEQP